ncbi:hypothetical protein GH714_008220 [Hevea brasiliensis]|uniref:Rhodanese domain-containing protein n=1 Tax=Hevea brasiliensis TaxID=3981 RepID=A0A6A6KM76_HEVBR|nr:hypothetical protein GH714_008220 [Hevea brasiliensis]
MAIQLKLNHLHTYALKHEKQRKPGLSTSAPQRSQKFQAKAAPNARQLLQSGAIKPIPAKDAAMAMSSEGFVLLDIRPSWEIEKARVSGSLHVPFFVQDLDNGPLTLLKKWVHFGYIGLWTGQNFTTLNPDFLRQVHGSFKVVRERIQEPRMLAGGFNRAADGDFPDVEGPEELQYATIGGVSYYFLQLLILLQAVGKSN